MSKIRVGVISGTGEEGKGLALRWALSGAIVTIGSRAVERARAAAAEVNVLLGQDIVEGLDNSQVISGSEFILLTVPFEHAASTLIQYRDSFRKGSLLLDITVPVAFDKGRAVYNEPPEGSASQHLQKFLPVDVPLIAAFKTEPAHLMLDPHASLDCSTFVACDSKEIRQRVMEAISSISGLRPVDAGPLSSAQVLERLTVFLIGMNRRYKVRTGRLRVLGLE